MNSSVTSRIVQDVLRGDASLMAEISTVPHQELFESVAGQSLMLTEHAVTRVLHDLRAGRVEPGDVQHWASFVRRGVVEGVGSGPMKPLDIEYVPEFEDAIVEAVGRMDEIGDIVDGELRPEEIDELLDALHSPT